MVVVVWWGWLSSLIRPLAPCPSLARKDREEVLSAKKERGEVASLLGEPVCSLARVCKRSKFRGMQARYVFSQFVRLTVSISVLGCP